MMRVALFPIPLILCLAIALAMPRPAAALDLGDLIDLGSKLKKASGKVSVEEEIEMGGNLISGLLGAAPLVDDPELQRYVNDVGHWVASQSKRRDLPWTFGVIDSEGINAFAAPGGYIVLTLGLFNLLENEAQLAGVLAHEIAHILRKHHLKALQKTMKRDFLASLAVAAVDDEQDQRNLQRLVNTGVQLYATGLDRKYEYEADLRGVVLAARAGYDPYALLDVLNTIDSINPDSASLAVFMKTHPPLDQRLLRLSDDMDGRLDKYASGRTNDERFQRILAGE